MPAIALSPHQRLYLEGEVLPTLQAMVEAFASGSGRGLLFLDTATDVVTEEPTFAYWKDFARLYLSLFAATPELENRDLALNPVQVDLQKDDLSRLLLTIPLMKGAEYLSEECLLSLWQEMGQALIGEIGQYGKGVGPYFEERHAGHSLLGRVCFHLAENKNSPDTPFAFLATYAYQVSAQGKTQHLPLRQSVKITSLSYV